MPIQGFGKLLDPSWWQRRCLRGSLGTITHVATTSPLVALTFDDGPDPASTPRLLEILAAHKARATFFMLGRAAHRYPDLVRKVAQDGHAIGNHSWDHPSFPLIRGTERRAQIRRCARSLGVHGTRLLRPPFGQQNFASRIDAFLLGYRVVTWNVVAWDWLERGSERMTRELLEQIRPGSIVLLHDTLADGGYSDGSHADRDEMLTAVSSVLESLKNAMMFVTVPELLARGRAQRQPWLVSPSSDFAERVRQRRTRHATSA
jgi:peptidoglycan/xylan/chitin deacetylase (PgdA/CDA1 family)